MSYKGIGAILVIAGCGGFGISIALAYRKEERMVEQLIRALRCMRLELQYRLTPLPELCLLAARECKGTLENVFSTLSRELKHTASSEVVSCMATALEEARELPPAVRKLLRRLGKSLGRFDLDGQLQGLDALLEACKERKKTLGKDREIRLRSYQTLALCAGAALVILLA